MSSSINKSLYLLLCLFCVFCELHAQESRVSGTIKVFPWIKLPIVVSTDIQGGMQSLGDVSLSNDPSTDLNTAVPDFKRTNGMVVSVIDNGKTRHFEYKQTTISWSEVFVTYNWEPGHSYVVGDFVAHQGNFYVAKTNHTSSDFDTEASLNWNNAGGKDGKYSASELVSQKIKITDGAQNGFVLKSDVDGNASWEAWNTMYKGTWDASANIPALADGVGSAGDYYLVKTGGTRFSVDFVAGDQVVYNGSSWERITFPQIVTGVNGETGLIQIDPVLSGNTLSLTGGTQTVDLSAMTAITDINDKLPDFIPYSGATQDVDFGGKKLKVNTLQITDRAQPGYVLKSDGSGNASWDAPSTAYKGTWDANSNTPSLSNGNGIAGDYYLVTVSGSQFGKAFAAGGQAVYNGTIWEPVANAQTVASVNSLTGAVQINPTLSGNTLSLTGGTQTIDLSQATIIQNIQSSIAGGTQTITLTGDVAGAGISTIDATLADNSVITSKIADNAVTMGKMEQITARTLIGNPSGSSSSPSEISIGTGLTFDADGKLSASASSGLPSIAAGDANKLLKVNSSLAAEWEATVEVSGDIEAGDDGSLTIKPGSVLLNHMAALSDPQKLLGSDESGKAVQEISLGNGLSFDGITLNVTASSGTVSSVGLNLPSIFNVTNSPVTGSGDLTADLASQSANTVFAAPVGTAGAPVFRNLVADDIPSLDFSKIEPGSLPNTLAGHGISGLQVSDIPLLDWSVINSGLPTTLDGYGITDAALIDHSHAVADASNDGFITSADKTKLDGIEASANNYIHPTGDGNLHVPATGSTNDGKILKAGATAGAITWEAPVAVGGDLMADQSGNLTINADAVTSAKIDDGTILDSDISAMAAIDGKKVKPDFGTQSIITTSTVSGSSFVSTSDSRLKQNIRTLAGVIDNINQLRGVRFEFIDQNKYAVGPQIGVVAQELKRIYPELVHTGDDGFLQVNYSQLSAVVLQGVIELNQRMDRLEQKSRELESRWAEQQNEINQIKSSLEALVGKSETSN